MRIFDKLRIKRAGVSRKFYFASKQDSVIGSIESQVLARVLASRATLPLNPCLHERASVGDGREKCGGCRGHLAAKIDFIDGFGDGWCHREFRVTREQSHVLSN